LNPDTPTLFFFFKRFGTPPERIPSAIPTVAVPPPAQRVHVSADIQKLRVEVMRLENLVKKLQSELAAEREYARALEAHVKTLQDVD
jgi:hypothetical protein